MTIYRSAVVGLPFEGRATYVKSNVDYNDDVDLRLEPENPLDSMAVAVFHKGFKIGYIPARHRWIYEVISEGKPPTAVVTDFTYNSSDELSAVNLAIIIYQEEGPSDEEVISTGSVRNELRLLAMIATADRVFKKKERELLEQYALLRLDDLGIKNTPIKTIKGMVANARRTPPDDSEIVDILEFLRTIGKEALEALWQVSGLIAEVDGKIDANEVLYQPS